MLGYFRLLRPLQWAKNVFVLMPLFFDRHLFDVAFIIPTLIVALSYCFASSGIYCLNDVRDAEADRLHPVKRMRPIASGDVSKRSGIALMAGCFIVSLLLLTGAGGGNAKALYAVILIHIVLNVAYCFWLKQKAIVDVFIISFGFVLRIVAGGMATGIWLSHWIILMTFLLALFLAFAKRRDDVVIYESSGQKVRNNVERYNVQFLNAALTVIASITLVCYIMYSVSPEVCDRFGSRYVYLTSIFVLAAIIRYLQVTLVDLRSGSPTMVLVKDRFIQACIAGWVLMFAIILYL